MAWVSFAQLGTSVAKKQPPFLICGTGINKWLTIIAQLGSKRIIRATAKTGLHYHYFSIKIFLNSNTKPANSSKNYYGCKAISTSVESLFLHLKRHTVSRLRLIISMYKFTKPTTSWFLMHHPQHWSWPHWQQLARFHYSIQSIFLV